MIYNSFETTFQQQSKTSTRGEGTVKVILDCDNTFGVRGRDIDDGLALLYLLGREGVELAGVTTTFGNGSIDEVFDATRRLLSELGAVDTPLLKGAPSPENRESEASLFLADIVAARPGEMSILATGSCTNLLGALRHDGGFFENAREIVLMGGATAPLVIRGKSLEELNFSCDPEASLEVLASGRAAVVTGNLCLEAPLDRTSVSRFFERCPGSFISRRKEVVYGWFDTVHQEFLEDRIYVWDAVAALFMTERDRFAFTQTAVRATTESLSTGYFVPLSAEQTRQSPSPHRVGPVILPHGMNWTYLRSRLFESWSRVTGKM
jgi:inosine-uridine nucleoside N-ribohydrolase